MKIDTHTHTSGVSFCSEVSPQQFVERYREEGYGAVILTNHYSKMYMRRYGDTWEEQIRVYTEEYRTAARAGEAIGLQVWLGAEVAISTPQSPYVEFLLYGIDEEFLRNTPRLYDKTQAELYELCHAANALLFQSHPFRDEQGHFPQDPAYLDGTEINCHPYFLRHEDKVRAFADRHDLMLVCGSDFHYAYQAGTAATIVPDDLHGAEDFAAYLRRVPRPEFFIK